MASPIKVVVLELEGDCRSEPVRVRLEMSLEGNTPTIRKKGELPPNPGLIQALYRWRDRYRQLGQVSRALRPDEILYEGGVGAMALEECRNAAESLTTSFQDWLSADSFRPLDEVLREDLHRNESIQVSIRTENGDLQRLPWHLWRFIERYPQAEVGLSAPMAELPALVVKPRHSKKVRILAILGHSDGIDVETDQRLLQRIKGAEVCFLAQPSRAKLSQSLWDQQWDILFFAGHSETAATQGRIHLNPEDSLTLDELKNSLRRAIAQGLQLAIFNSCDGLGLAYELEQLNIPYMIVMREPVPDRVAQSFLRGFLHAFALGQSLHEAVREARERLEGVENDFPCASWLPVIYQNPMVNVLDWQTLQQPTKQKQLAPGVSSDSSLFPKIQTSPGFIAIAIIVTVSIVSVLESFGLFQSAELWVYDQFLRLRPKLPPDERLLVITVDADDIRYQDEQGMNRIEGRSLSDDALYEILKYAHRDEPRVVGLDIIHPHDFDPKLSEGIDYTEKFIGVCQGDSSDVAVEHSTPPPGFDIQQYGFSDLPFDPDHRKRRQLILKSPGEKCASSRSFAIRLVEDYLLKIGEINYRVKKLGDGRRSLGKHTFARLEHDSGGYRLPVSESAGYQILNPYRYQWTETLTLKRFLVDLEKNSDSLERLFENRKIIIIGGDQANQDQHLTPISNKRKPGVLIQAQMTSTVLDAVLSNYSLKWLHGYVEKLIMGLWLTLGVWIVTICCSGLIQYIVFGIYIFTILPICFCSIAVFDVWLPSIESIIASMLLPMMLSLLTKLVRI